MQSPLLVRAIDVGYGHTKFSVDSNGAGQVHCQRFPSIATLPAANTFVGAGFRRRNTLQVRVAGQIYEVGPEVIDAVGPHATRHRDAQFVFSPHYSALVRGALKAMQVRALDALVLGAPVANHSEVADHLRRQFSGRIDLDGEREVEVGQVLVLPQPLGGFAWLAEQHGIYDRVRAQLNLIVDPGYFTLDWLVAMGTRQRPERSGSHPAGVAAIIDGLLKAIAQGRGGALDANLELRERIDRALYEGSPFTLGSHAYDLAQHEGVIREVVHRGVTELRATVGSSADLENIVLVGGGAPIYLEPLKQAFPQHTVLSLSDPAFANVCGFQIVGERVLAATKAVA